MHEWPWSLDALWSGTELLGRLPLLVTVGRLLCDVLALRHVGRLLCDIDTAVGRVAENIR